MSDPDFAEIEKAIGEKPDLRLGCGYEQGWPGLYVYDQKSGLVVASEDVEPTDAFVDKYLNRVPVGNLAPAIAPMALGERPTEPGIYMTKYERLVEIVTGTDGYLWALTFGQDRVCHPDRFTFIARIYPDRIEGREG